MKIPVLSIVIFIVYSNLILFGQIPKFELHKIGDADGQLLGQSSLTDIDHDGDFDWIVGSSGRSVWWFEYQAPDKWVKHLIGEDNLTDRGGVAFDVDGDGEIDQVSGGTWYRNLGSGENFERFENKAVFAYDNITGDLNGDGKPDLVAMSEQEGLFWYEIRPGKSHKKWKETKIGDGVAGGIFPHSIADIDNDGDNDILRSNVWYENTKGDGSDWLPHRTISFVESTGKFANSSRVWMIDMDGDGYVDIVQAESNNPSGKIAWHENKDGRGINWFTHKIDYSTDQDLHSLCVADFDNDGDPDVFSGGGPITGDLHKRLFIWENLDGKGEEWKRHEILTDKECHDAIAADVDGDGDTDICFKPWKGTTSYYLRNMLIESSK